LANTIVEEKSYPSSLLFFDRKIEAAIVGLPREYSKLLNNISNNNALIIANYIISMKTEINLSDNYRKDLIKVLSKLAMFCCCSSNNNKLSFDRLGREDIVAFLNSFRKPEASDPLHKWIGTYNIYRIHLMRFFKWLYYPDIESDKRPKPEVIENIPQLKRKETSIYKPTDLWTASDDLLFLTYCPSKRIKCFHAMSKDTACRPHELLKLRIKDIMFKTTAANHQYAEVLVNGKTGSRHIPLIDSIPYIKDYLDHEHPQPGNPSAIFLCGNRKSLGKAIKIQTIELIYRQYKKELFPKLLDDPNVPPEDKQKIKELLKKPWNPYIRRHSALTEKSTILKEHVLRQYAGWSPRSQMHLKYIHYFGNEACESLLEAYGIVTKDQKLTDALRPKQCPNCSEPNKPDSRFCAKCRMVLTYDAYAQTIENAEQKDDEIKTIKEQIQALILAVSSMKDQNQINNFTHQLYNAGIFQVSKSSPGK
jgi:integrase/recombinase XerD